VKGGGGKKRMNDLIWCPAASGANMLYLQVIFNPHNEKQTRTQMSHEKTIDPHLHTAIQQDNDRVLCMLWIGL
jgi:hypothetical protein